MAVGPVEFGLGAVGAALVVAAVRNVSPVSVVTGAIRGSSTPPVPIHTPAAAPATGAAAGLASGGDVDAFALDPIDPPNLVEWRNDASVPDPYSGHVSQVTPETRAGLEAWSAAFGQRIALTSGYRSFESQAKSHAREPNRFAPADKSWHVRGRAVDVHLAAMGATNDLTLRKLHRAGERTGWCFAGKSGPMHASYGGCG